MSEVELSPAYLSGVVTPVSVDFLDAGGSKVDSAPLR